MNMRIIAKGFLLLPLLLSSCIVTVVCQGLCEPDCKGKNPNDKVEDPTDCTKYYYCLGDGIPSDAAVSCTVGEHFDPAINDCGPGSECTPSCTLGSTPTATPVDGIATAGGCLDSLLCELTGYFPMCQMCLQEYFICYDIGQLATQGKCTGNLVFNPDDSYPYCIPPENCPYSVTTTIPGDTTPGDCLTSLTCTALGLFPMCQNTCQQDYFSCTTIGQPATIDSCSGIYVFNTDPNYAACILPENCPYHPH